MSRHLTMLISAALTGALLGACSPAAPPAQESSATAALASTLAISLTRATPTPEGAHMSAGFLVIANHGEAADTLVSASSPRAGRVELHETVMDGAVMQMRPIPSVAIEPGGEARFEHGGRHLMFVDVAVPFKAGEVIPVTLVFENAGAVEAQFPVSANASSASTSMGDMHR